MHSCSFTYLDKTVTSFAPLEENNMIGSAITSVTNFNLLREITIFLSDTEKLNSCIVQARDFIIFMEEETKRIVKAMREADRKVKMEWSPVNRIRIQKGLKKEYVGRERFAEYMKEECKKMMEKAKDHPDFVKESKVEFNMDYPWYYYEYEELERGSVTLYFPEGVSVVMNKLFVFGTINGDLMV